MAAGIAVATLRPTAEAPQNPARSRRRARNRQKMMNADTDN
jgi:hypothetical protein